MIEVFTLVVITLSDGGVYSYTRSFPTEQQCRIAEALTKDAIPRALAVLDAGTICIKSELNPDLKPGA